MSVNYITYKMNIIAYAFKAPKGAYSIEKTILDYFSSSVYT